MKCFRCISTYLFQGINFCHSRLVAHLDLDSDNILHNFSGGGTQILNAPSATPFRSYFPVRYYLNDFEFAVTFDPDSEPASRVVTGIPLNGIRAGEYGRRPAPEMSSGLPYCPFRADIYQLGIMFCYDLGVCIYSGMYLFLYDHSSQCF